jgi:hypothetical protein
MIIYNPRLLYFMTWVLMPIRNFLFKQIYQYHHKQEKTADRIQAERLSVEDFAVRSHNFVRAPQSHTFLSDTNPQCHVYLTYFKTHVLSARKPECDDKSDIDETHMGFNGVSRR